VKTLQIENSSPQTMFVIVAIAFVLELLIFSALHVFGVPRDPIAAALLNAGLLAVLLAGPVYWMTQRRTSSGGESQRGLERLSADTTQLAITDSLTRIMNRRGITVSLLDAMAQAERYNTPLSVALGDIDHLKRINETHGHGTGDKVLSHTAAVLSETLRMPDKVGRYGGEEFLVIFPHTGLAQARKIAERMRGAVQKSKLDIDRNKVQVTLSLGVTQFQKGEDLEQLLSRVDKALVQAKSGGRNLVAAQKAARAGRD
jgi:diguanylate cyclase (GGDEF)-like protein